MKALFITGLFTDKYYETIMSNIKGMPEIAANSLQWSYVMGFSTMFDLSLLNMPFVGDYPKRYSKMILPQGSLQGQYKGINAKGYDPQIYTIKGLQGICRYYETKRYVKKWMRELEDERGVIILYSLVSWPSLAAIKSVLRDHTRVKIVMIVPDLFQFMGGEIVKGSLKYYYIKLLNDITTPLIKKHVDALVLLSEHMKEFLPVSGKSSIIIEGIYNPNEFCNISNSKTNDAFKILYAGTLARRYGILNLIEAVHSSKIKKLILEIYGDGDAKDEILKYQKADARIKYKGVCSKDEISYRLASADLLVNPRTSSESYTKYSFPSKTLEYFASGTPVLMGRLPGIPSEYFKYCYVADTDSIDSIRMKIEELYEMSETQLQEIGKSAQAFINKDKTPAKQCMRVYEMILKCWQ